MFLKFMFLSEFDFFHHASGDALDSRPEVSEGNIWDFLGSVGHEVRFHSLVIVIWCFLQRYKHAGFIISG